MRVSAVIPTRGDVSIDPVLESLPATWELVVWDNRGEVTVHLPSGISAVHRHNGDVSVFGRYVAISHATGDVIYTQDDDVIVDSPAEIVEMWAVSAWARMDHVVCNMPPEFRHDFYKHHALVGFGAAFHRDAPARAFSRWSLSDPPEEPMRVFNNTADVVFTGLSPRVLVDVGKSNLPWAEAPERMYRQPHHQEERKIALEWVLEVARG